MSSESSVKADKTPLCEWITLFDPASQPGLDLDIRHKHILKSAQIITENHPDPYPASTLMNVLQDNPLSSYFDPSDDAESGDELEVNIICKVIFFRDGSRHHYACIEYDTSVDFWDEYETETQN